MKTIRFALCIFMFTCCAVECADVVRVQATRYTTGHGWGVAVGPDLVLTAAHVLKDDKGYRETKVEVDGKWLNAELVRYDNEADLALLKVKAKLSPAAVAKPEVLILFGSPALTAGKPRVAKPYQVRMTVDWKGDGLGISGAPVFNSAGELRGILIRQGSFSSVAIEGEAVVIPSDIIAAFLKIF